jgi:hypothetical protein
VRYHVLAIDDETARAVQLARLRIPMVELQVVHERFLRAVVERDPPDLVFGDWYRGAGMLSESARWLVSWAGAHHRIVGLADLAAASPELIGATVSWFAARCREQRALSHEVVELVRHAEPKQRRVFALSCALSAGELQNGDHRVLDFLLELLRSEARAGRWSNASSTVEGWSGMLRKSAISGLTQSPDRGHQNPGQSNLELARYHACCCYAAALGPHDRRAAEDAAYHLARLAHGRATLVWLARSELSRPVVRRGSGALNRRVRH